jgi:hypothetical protein
MAEYGKQCLQRTLRKGVRQMSASITEILSVVDHPATTRMPQAMSIRINLPTGSEFLCGFDPQSTCADVTDFISSRLTMRSATVSSFGLYVSDPSGEHSWHAVRGGTKICDFLASWELAYREASVGHVDYNAVPKVVFQRRLYFRRNQCDDEIESILLAYQVSLECASDFCGQNRHGCGWCCRFESTKGAWSVSHDLRRGGLDVGVLLAHCAWCHWHSVAPFNSCVCR